MTMTAEKKNVLILSLAQALYGTCFTILVTLNSLVGHELAPSAALATLPMTAMIIGTAISTVPASLLMQRFGRRPGFMGGALMAIFGAGLQCLAIWRADFGLFVGGSVVYGAFNATAQYYRFAAADASSAGFRPRAIGLVIAGGAVAAIVGPALVVITRDLMLPINFLGAYLAVVLIGLLNLAVTSMVNIPPPQKVTDAGSAARPLRAILAQPAFIVAVMAGIIAQGTMTFVMTATPLAMVGCALSINAAALVIQWHALAMYLPALITGNLITRFGIFPVMLTGFAILVCCAAAAMSGTGLFSFWLALIFLGLGWSLSFVGATALLAETYAPSERGKAQGLNDFVVYVVVAGASFGAGQVLAQAGWWTLNWLPLPFITATAAAVIWLAVQRRQTLGRQFRQ
jgi:predicted MFS family arabinose efflux permease